jgi:hypothetical protein
MLRIEKESNGHTTTLRLRGRIQPANMGNIRAQLDDDRVRIFMDLDEVTLVDVEIVRFLSECENRGIVLVHCPPYVRAWILRERAEGATAASSEWCVIREGDTISLTSSGPCYQILSLDAWADPPQKVNPSVLGQFSIPHSSPW